MRLASGLRSVKRLRGSSYLSFERNDLPIHRFEHGFALIDKAGLRRVAGLGASGHGDEIVVVDVYAPGQPVLVSLVFGAGPAPAGGPAQRPHRAGASVTLPLTFKQQS